MPGRQDEKVCSTCREKRTNELARIGTSRVPLPIELVERQSAVVERTPTLQAEDESLGVLVVRYLRKSPHPWGLNHASRRVPRDLHVEGLGDPVRQLCHEVFGLNLG